MYPFATKRALYLSIVPSALRLIRNTHLFPIALRLGGKSTKSQTWLTFIDSISSSIALIHCSLACDIRASFTFLGSSLSCTASMKASPSISKRRRGIIVRLLRLVGRSFGTNPTFGSLPLVVDDLGWSLDIWLGVIVMSWSSNSSIWTLLSMSPFLGNSFSMNVTSLDSSSVIPPSICSPINTYPLECSEYLIKIHFLPLWPNFPYLLDGSWTYAAEPQGRKWPSSGFRPVHNSYGVEMTDFVGTRLSI